MANAIPSQTIPSWVINHLGKQVRFTQLFDFYGNGNFVCNVNDQATLDAVQVGPEGLEAVVYFPEDPSYFVNCPIRFIARSSSIRY